ncbi:MAG: 2TM domain-containing protein [Dermatophilus congolensis]|nr:2TM domain-containing protein [Dermatophilus congolensis]
MTEQPIEPYESARGDIDPAVRSIAKKRLQARREFSQHLASYAVIMTMLVVIWAVTGASYFWPMWPMLGWGIGIAFHALSLRDNGITEDQIAKEAAKIEARREQRPTAPREMPRLDGPQDTV